MRLATPEFLFLLLLFPAAWAVRHALARKGSDRAAMGFANFLALWRTPAGWRARAAGLLPVLRILGLLGLVVALARPQTEDWETLAGEGIDIMVCLDMSGSMNAVDLDFDAIGGHQEQGREPPNRFDVARETLKQFVANRKGDRVGLVVFSNEAYLKFPLTLDYQTVVNQLDELRLDNLERDQRRAGCINNCTINGEQTAIGDALAKAYKRLEQSDAKGKLVVLITDGNDNASKLKPMDVANYIGEQPDSSRPGLYSFLVGGGPKSKMPVRHNGRLLRQHGFLQYAPYEEQVDEDRIQEMTEAARGIFHAAYDEEEFRTSFADLEKSEHLEQKIARHKDLFPVVLLLSLILLGLEFLAHVTILRRFP